MMRRNRRVPECGHPQSPHYGKGMCRKCYRKRYEVTNSEHHQLHHRSCQINKRRQDAMSGIGPLICVHKDREHFRAGYCQECYEKRQEDKRGAYNSNQGQSDYLKKAYGITLEQYTDMYNKQNGKCLICARPGINGLCVEKDKRLHVDHDHDTGMIRGLLCNNCNRGLGCFMDNPQLLLKASEYLNQHSKKGTSDE